MTGVARALACAGLLLAAVVARADASDPRVIVLCLPGLQVEDIDARTTPNLDRIAASGAASLVNTVTRASTASPGLSSDALASAYLTLGMGARGRCGQIAYEPAAPSIPVAVAQELRRANDDGTRPGVPGWLGGRLLSAGAISAAVGCQDLGATIYRPLVLAAMDPDGAAGGETGRGCLRLNPQAAFGLEADRRALLRRVEELLSGQGPRRPPAAVIWVDGGDLSRSQAYARYCLPARAAGLRRAALAGADLLAGELLALSQRSGASLLVLAPTGAAAGSSVERWLTPAFWVGVAPEPGGTLYSGSTRRSGVLTLSDFAGALAQRVVPGAPGDSRDVVRRQAAENGWRGVRQLYQRIQRAEAGRIPGLRLIQLLLALQSLLVILAIRRGWGGRATRAIAWGPAVLFWLTLLCTPSGPGLPALLAAAGALGVLAAVRRPERMLPVACGGLALAIAAELLPGGHALDEAVLGYSLSLGARFYGIGNEWMGGLLGAALAVALSAGAGQGSSGAPRGWATRLAIGLAALTLLAAPGGGANVGGGLTALVMTLSLLLAEGGARGRFRILLGAAGAAILLLALVAALDATRPYAQQTHFGRLLNGMGSGLGTLGSAAAAKLAVSWRLIQTFWGLVVLAELAAIVAICRAGRGARPQPEPGVEPVRRAVPVVATALAAILFNDSGVIAAALMLPLAIPCIWRFDGRRPSGPQPGVQPVA